MQTFTYTITDPEGLHARPAAILVKQNSKYNSDIIIKCGSKSGNAKKIFGIMGLGVKKGQDVTLEISGEDEETACDEIKNFFEENL